MKLVKYTLTKDGRTPDYIESSVIDGGWLLKTNDLDPPMDNVLVGVGLVDENNLPQNVEVITSRDELVQEYLENLSDDWTEEDATNRANMIYDKYEASLQS